MILIGCEKSAIVRDAFIKLGHDAISCDLLPSDRPGPHIQGDIVQAIRDHFTHSYDQASMIIMFPDCTKLCVSGNHVYAKGKEKWIERQRSAEWTFDLWQQCRRVCRRVAFENPVGVLSTMTDMPKAHYIQPYDFGEDASKKTGLILHNLPPLKSTKRVAGRIVNGVERWSNQTDSGQNRLGPSDDRAEIRGKTYQGIADAFALQWGNILTQGE